MVNLKNLQTTIRKKDTGESREKYVNIQQNLYELRSLLSENGETFLDESDLCKSWRFLKPKIKDGSGGELIPKESEKLFSIQHMIWIF